MDKIKKAIDELYIAKKIELLESNGMFSQLAPELLPKGIISDQVKATIEVFSEIIETLCNRITNLESKMSDIYPDIK